MRQPWAAPAVRSNQQRYLPEMLALAAAHSAARAGQLTRSACAGLAATPGAPSSGFFPTRRRSTPSRSSQSSKRLSARPPFSRARHATTRPTTTRWSTATIPVRRLINPQRCAWCTLPPEMVPGPRPRCPPRGRAIVDGLCDRLLYLRRAPGNVNRFGYMLAVLQGAAGWGALPCWRSNRNDGYWYEVVLKGRARWERVYSVDLNSLDWIFR